MVSAWRSRPRALVARLLINRAFGLLWVGQAISSIGDWVVDTTLVLWIADHLARGQPWAPLATSGVLLAASIPTVLVGPLAGVFVDRWDKRRTMLWADATRAALFLALLLLSGALPLPGAPGGHLPRPWLLGAIYAIVALAAACAQLFGPARLALVGDLVAEPERARASGLLQTTTNLAVIIGPPLAAPLLFTLGVQWALALDALTFVASFLALRAMRVPPRGPGRALPARGDIRREFGAGLRFFAGHPVLRTILVALLLVFIGGSGANALNYFFATQNLHAAPRLYGLLGAATGAGLLAGAALASWGAARFGLARTFWLGVAAMGALQVAYARLTDLGPALVVLFLQGVPNAALNVALGPLVLRVTPRALVGRVWAVLMPATNLAALLSTLAAGYLISAPLRDFRASVLGIAIGPVDTVIGAAGLLMVGGGLYAMVGLRRMTGLDDTVAQPTPADERGERTT